MCKVINTSPSLVRLHRAVRRWRSRAAASVCPDRESTAVPAGHVAVRVEGRAGDARRFVVRLAQLSHPAFRELLRQAEEEYGFPPGASGPLALPCDEDRLRDVLRLVSPSPVSEERQSFRRRRGDSRPLLSGMAMVHGEARLVIDQSFLRKIAVCIWSLFIQDPAAGTVRAPMSPCRGVSAGAETGRDSKDCWTRQGALTGRPDVELC